MALAALREALRLERPDAEDRARGAVVEEAADAAGEPRGDTAVGVVAVAGAVAAAGAGVVVALGGVS